MEFLSRLIGGVGTTSARKVPSNSPQHRLARFKKVYSHTLHVWHRLSPASKADPASVETLRTCLQRLTTLLHDDTRAPSPHLCVSFAASQQVYITITRICLSLQDEDIIREAVSWFSALVDNDEENMLGDERFAEQLMAFAENLSSLPGLSGSHTEGEVLELLFGIAAKIRLEPDLLPIWFMSEEEAETIATGSGGPGQSIPLGDHKRFPLCYQFIGRVYNQGRAGDFARTGLLYIFESVSSSPELERWIIESDLPTLMASGLGALYSQLSRKLSISHPLENLPLILALSDDAVPASRETDVDNFYSEELQSQLSTFMSNLVFWQDILDHCRSLEIKQALVDHFQVFFLQQILYPSLLESSDIDGGSSVAVLTYLWRILDSLEHPDLIHLILRYLLAMFEAISAHPSTPRSPAAEKRRESLLSLSQNDGGEDQLNPSFFNLTDLILASVQSNNAETLTAALRLITVLLMKHHAYSYASLLRVVTQRSSSIPRNLGALQKETGMLYGFATAIGGDEGIDQAYDNCLKDALALVECHTCTATRLGIGDMGPGISNKHRSAILEDESQMIQSHCLLPDDPLLASLMELMNTFFTNNVETNLGLTNVLTHLASCPYTSLESWLVADLTKYQQESNPSSPAQADEQEESSCDINDPDQEENKRIEAFRAASRLPEWSAEDTPAIFHVFEHLSEQMRIMHATIPNLDRLIAGRKRAFEGASELEEQFSVIPPLHFNPKISTPGSRASSKTRITQLDGPLRTLPNKDSPISLARGRTIGGSQRSIRPESPGAMSSRPISIARGESPSRFSGRGLSVSPTKLARTLSPLASVVTAGETRFEAMSVTSGSIEARAAEAAILDRKLTFPLSSPNNHDQEGSESTEDSSLESGKLTGHGPRKAAKADARETSLSHVLTNIVILQEFVLELMALVQVRSSLLNGEITFQ